MKTKLLTLVIAVFTFSAANAQFHLGIKGGANMSKITGKSFSEEYEFGYHLGGFAEIGLGKKFSLQPEVLFNQTNQYTSSEFDDLYQNVLSSEISNIKLNYLSVPILLNYKASNIVSLQLGPQFGILMDQNKNLLENGQEAFKNGDFSMVGGAQIKLSMLRLTGRYMVGLSNINDIDNQDKWKSQGFQLSLGIAL